MRSYLRLNISRRSGAVACMLALAPLHSIAGDFIVNDATILDAISNEAGFTSDQLTQLDLNEDGQVDVADLVKWLQTNNPTRIAATFTSQFSALAEGQGSVTVTVTLSKPFTGAVAYTIGGTASPDRTLGTAVNPAAGDPLQPRDFVAPSGVLLFNNETSKNIVVSAVADDRYEDDETITLSLLPTDGIAIQNIDVHTITVSDAPNQTSAPFVVILTRNTEPLAGDLAGGTALASAQESRQLLVRLTQNSAGNYDTVLIGSRSSGVPPQDVQGTAEYNAGTQTLSLEFEYQQELESFVDDSPITTALSVDPTNPLAFVALGATGGLNKRILQHKLRIELQSLDLGAQFDPSDVTTEGSYQESVSGGLTGTSEVLVEGNALASIYIESPTEGGSK